MFPTQPPAPPQLQKFFFNNINKGKLFTSTLFFFFFGCLIGSVVVVFNVMKFEIFPGGEFFYSACKNNQVFQ